MRAAHDPAPRAAGPRGASEELLDLVRAAAFFLDRERRIVVWSPAAAELTGHRAEDVLGADVARIIDPAARSRAAYLVDRVTGGAGWVGYVPLLRADGSGLEAVVQAAALRFPGGRDLIQLLVADAAGLRRAAFERTLFESLFNQIPLGISIYDPNRRYLRVNGVVGEYNRLPAAEHVGLRVEDVLPDLDPSVAQIQKHVLATGEPVVDRIIKITPDASRPRGGAGRADTSRFLSASYARLESAEGRILGLTAITVDVTERQRAVQRSRTARRRAAILNAANNRIGTSLEPGSTAAELAHVAVPLFADAVRVYLVDTADGAAPAAPGPPTGPAQPLSLRPVVIRRKPGRAPSAPANSAREHLPPILPGTDLHKALLAGRALFIHFSGDSSDALPSLVPAASSNASTNAVMRTTDPQRQGQGQGQGHAQAQRQGQHQGRGRGRGQGQGQGQGRKSGAAPGGGGEAPAPPGTGGGNGGEQYIAAPLVARGALLGVVSFSRDPDRDLFADDDLEIAEELAARTAVGLDNARLYARERAAALMLQRSLLQEQIPRVEGLRLAFRYRPGSADAEVGGDWLDMFALPGCRVAFVIGDVMGSGLRAAGIMGQFRIAARTLAQLDLGPAAVLRELDRLAASMSDAHIATCVYAIYDPIAGRCVLSAAGHLPPIIIGPRGGARTIELPPGAPLGVGGVRFEEREIALEAGCGLVLYTDGLVEDRYRDIDEGIEELLAAVGKADPSAGGAWPEAACDDAFDTLLDSTRLDDATLLIAALGRFPGDAVAAWVLSAQPTVAAQARDLVCRQLERWAAAGSPGLARVADVTELLVSELVTNAARYGRGPIGLRLLNAPAALVCEVSDDLDTAPRLRTVHHGEEGGRGLYLVDQLSTRWGSRTVAHGKTVWFELAVRG